MQILQRFFPHILIAFLFGVLVGVTKFSGVAELSLFALFTVSMLMVGVVMRSHRAYIGVLLIAFFLIGLLRFSFWEKEPIDPIFLEQIGKTTTIEGVIVDEPDVRETNTHLTLATTSINGIESQILLFVPTYPEFHYGDMVRVTGKLEQPKKFSEQDGRVFDYPSYLASKGVHYQIFFPQIELVQAGSGNVLVSALYKFKEYLVGAIGEMLPEPHSALLSGLLLGGKRSLGESWLDIFRTAGIIHIVVLSGYNMTVVADWMMTLFRFAGFYGSLSFGGIGIFLFAIMTGGGATVVRAAVMAFIAILARATGRTYTMSRALLFAGAVMVMHNPSIILYDPSFQLSFLASFGLVLVSPVIERRTTIFSSHKILREIFVSTCATQVLVLPLLLYQTGMLSLVSLPVNMLVLPLIPVTMFFGFVAGVITILIPLLSSIAMLPAYVTLSYILHIAEWSTYVPYAKVSVSFSLFTTASLYVAILVYLYIEHRTTHQDHPHRSHEAPPQN